MALIQFSHANGFPARSYKTFFSAFPDTFEIRAVERIGMDPRYPVTPGWPHLVTQLCEAIEAAPEAPILVGHSLGGLLSLMAAYRLPRRVRAVLMIDSPILGAPLAALVSLVKLVGLDGRVPPARLSLRRRDSWPDRATAHNHLSRKPLFAAFDSRALDDYLDGALVPAEEGLVLAIDRNIETIIYRTLPHTLYRRIGRRSQVPCGFLAGTRSRELTQAGFAASRRFVDPYFRWFEGGHLLTMERPEAAAAAVLRLFGEMGIL